MKNIIGNTPLVKINYEINNKKYSVYTKLEWYSLTGSVKDRMAEYIILESKKKGILKDNQTIVETTSGNTGIALAAAGAKHKHKVVIFMPEDVSKERISIIKMYGAEVHLIKKEDGGFNKCTELSQKYSADNNAFLFNQFENLLNAKSQEKLGNEISKKLKKVDYFVSGIGSGGTAMGVCKVLKKNKSFKYIALEPSESQILSGKEVCAHKIEGIGDDFIPKLVDLKYIDKVIPIKSNDAICMARKLIKELGLGVGISSGANFLASTMVNEENKKTVTIFPDDLKKYLSTDLINDFEESEYIKSIKLIDYEVI